VDNTGRAAAELWHPGAPVPDPPPPSDTAKAVAAIAARPLFRQDRQPFQEQGGALSGGRNYETELSRLALIGTLTFGGGLTGIVVSKGAGTAERWEVKAGDQLSGFTVKAVQVDGLTLTADGRDFTLPLYAGAPAVTGAGTGRMAVPGTVSRPGNQPAATPGSSAAQPVQPASPSGIPPVYIPERSPSRPPRYYPRR
jgi:hypothetical protein